MSPLRGEGTSVAPRFAVAITECLGASRHDDEVRASLDTPLALGG